MPGDFFAGLSEGFEAQRKRKADLEDAIALLMARQKLDPEAQAQQQALDYAESSNPRPELRMSGSATPAQRQQMQGRLQEAEVGRSGRVLDTLQKYGFFRNTNDLSGIGYLVSDGVAKPLLDEAGNKIPTRGNRLMQQPMSPELVGKRSEASALGTAAGTPQTPAEREFDLGFESMSTSIDNALGMLAPDGEFQQALLNTGLPFKPGAAMLNVELTNAADVLLRLRSGAAINEQEYQRLRSLLPEGMDAMRELAANPGLAHKKLNRFKQEVDAVLGQKRNKLGQPMNTTAAPGTPPSNSSGTVTMQKAGKTYQIPSDQVEAALADGLTRAGR